MEGKALLLSYSSRMALTRPTDPFALIPEFLWPASTRHRIFSLAEAEPPEPRHWQ